jgi:hypothetical protein
MDVESALTAIPIACEDHRVIFGDAQRPVGIQVRNDFEAVPPELPLSEGRTREAHGHGGQAQRA